MKIQQQVSFASSGSDLDFEKNVTSELYNRELLLLPLFTLCFPKIFFSSSVTLVAIEGTTDIGHLCSPKWKVKVLSVAGQII